MQSPTIDQYLDTLTSPARTSAPTPEDSLPTDARLGDKVMRPVQCDVHGEVTSEVTRLVTSWTRAACPLCDEAEKAQETQRQAEREREYERDRAETRRRAAAERFEKSGVAARFHQKHFGDYAAPTPAAAKALKACSDYAADFPAARQTGASLILCGTAGTGKTHLAAAVVREVIVTHGLRAKFTTAGKLFRAVKSTYSRDSDDDEDAALARFTDPHLLVIDEVGVQFGSDFEKNILFEVINERYGAVKPTVLISNLSLDNLREYAGDRVIDRMKENGGKLVVFDWDSHRNARTAEVYAAPDGRRSESVRKPADYRGPEVRASVTVV